MYDVGWAATTAFISSRGALGFLLPPLLSPTLLPHLSTIIVLLIVIISLSGCTVHIGGHIIYICYDLLLHHHHQLLLMF